MTRSHTQDEAQEQAALYSLGALAEDECRAFEAHLQGGCALCAAEVAAFKDVSTLLAEAAPPRPPRAQVRTAVLQVPDAPSGAAVIEENGLRFVRAKQVAWEDSGSLGIDIKPLAVDPLRASRSVLVRMAPGTRYSAHRHADVEELYLVEGDLTVSGVLMQAGDYCRAEAGSVHTGISTKNGCVFVVFASDHNELIGEPVP